MLRALRRANAGRYGSANRDDGSRITGSAPRTRPGNQLYAALEAAEQRLGRPVQVTIRDQDWLTTGSGSFHDNVTSHPLYPLLP